jgi:hypothetical protein
MPQITITYEKPKTLQALTDFAKYFDFTIEKLIENKSSTVSKKKLNIVPGNKNIDISELSKLFTEKNIAAKQLRTELWQRK